jgi:hypothetical protein
MSRRWATALLCAYAGVLTAVFWPGPINGLTVLFIIGVDAVLILALLTVPFARRKLTAAYRHQADIIARTAPRGDDLLTVQRREQFVRDMQEIRDNNVFRTVDAVRGGS